MDVLIKNMNNKPKNCILEEHLSDGTVIKHEVVELPPHGDLIEKSNVLFNLQAEALGLYPLDKDYEGIKKGLILARKAVLDAPTVLEAST